MIRVGTSGYGYHAWSPEFYPSGLCYTAFLKHCASSFSCCELTHTFLRFAVGSPHRAPCARGPRVFSLHGQAAPSSDQRARARSECRAPFRRRNEAPLDSGRLAAVLAQFPFSFVNHPYNRAYSCRLRGELELPPSSSSETQRGSNGKRWTSRGAGRLVWRPLINRAPYARDLRFFQQSSRRQAVVNAQSLAKLVQRSQRASRVTEARAG